MILAIKYILYKLYRFTSYIFLIFIKPTVHINIRISNYYVNLNSSIIYINTCPRSIYYKTCSE